MAALSCISFLGLSLTLLSLVSAEAPSQCSDCSCNQPVVNCQKVCDVCACANNVIDCRSLRLKASFSSSNAYWPNDASLKSLYLDDNLIGRVVPFPPLNLTSISLQGNLLEAIDPKAFYHLTLLEDLDLSHNQLTTSVLLQEVFEGPYSQENYEPLSIQSLNLSHNELQDLNPDVFVHLPNLKRLLLNGNHLADENGNLRKNTVVAIAGGAPNLELLDLSQTGLSALPQTFLKNLYNLRELVLSDNYFKQLPTESLFHGQSLQILNFNSNPITVFSTTRAFPPMPNLIQLHISNMPSLKRIEDQALQGLVALNYLACSSNPTLEYISGTALSAANISKLELQDNSLHYLSDKLIARWDKLKYLDIQGNQWSCDCENQWMITTLIPLLKHNVDGLICSQPAPMKGSAMKKLSERNYQMRCLDYYGNHPERDGSFLVATFCIVIITLVLLGVVLVYKRGRCRKGREIDYTAIYQQQVRDDLEPRY